MHASGEALFVAAYALVLCAAAWGLHRLGRVNTDPWASRVLAGYRQQTQHVPRSRPDADWPHADARRMHTALGAVAASGALLLCAGEAVRHHAGGDLTALGPVAFVCLWVLSRLAGQLRA